MAKEEIINPALYMKLCGPWMENKEKDTNTEIQFQSIQHREILILMEIHPRVLRLVRPDYP